LALAVTAMFGLAFATVRTLIVVGPLRRFLPGPVAEPGVTLGADR